MCKSRDANAGVAWRVLQRREVTGSGCTGFGRVGWVPIRAPARRWVRHLVPFRRVSIPTPNHASSRHLSLFPSDSRSSSQAPSSYCIGACEIHWRLRAGTIVCQFNAVLDIVVNLTSRGTPGSRSQGFVEHLRTVGFFSASGVHRALTRCYCHPTPHTVVVTRHTRLGHRCWVLRRVPLYGWNPDPVSSERPKDGNRRSHDADGCFCCP